MRSRGNTAKSASGMRWYESTFLASALSRDSTRPRELQPVYGTFISSRYATTFASQIDTSSNASTRLKAICGFQSAIAVAQRAEVAADPQHLHLVAERAQRVDDVVLGLPVGARRLAACPRSSGGTRALVDERQHAELAARVLHAPRRHSGTRWRPSCRWVMVRAVSSVVNSSRASSSAPRSRSPSSRQRVTMSPSTWSIT